MKEEEKNKQIDVRGGDKKTKIGREESWKIYGNHDEDYRRKKESIN